MTAAREGWWDLRWNRGCCWEGIRFWIYLRHICWQSLQFPEVYPLVFLNHFSSHPLLHTPLPVWVSLWSTFYEVYKKYGESSANWHATGKKARNNITGCLHPPSSPDVALRDFWLLPSQNDHGGNVLNGFRTYQSSLDSVSKDTERSSRTASERSKNHGISVLESRESILRGD